MLIPHEGTHAMKQLKFQPYLDFLERAPDTVNLSTEEGRKLLERTAAHRKIDLIDMTAAQADILYDEINAMVSGIALAGKDGRILADLKEAFQDYDAYKSELLAIHQQFKNRNQAEQEPSPEPATTEEQIEVKEELGNQEQPKGNNFVIGAKGQKLPTTPKARYKANADAIQNLRVIMTEGKSY